MNTAASFLSRQRVSYTMNVVGILRLDEKDQRAQSGDERERRRAEDKQTAQEEEVRHLVAGFDLLTTCTPVHFIVSCLICI